MFYTYFTYFVGDDLHVEISSLFRLNICLGGILPILHLEFGSFHAEAFDWWTQFVRSERSLADSFSRLVIGQ